MSFHGRPCKMRKLALASFSTPLCMNFVLALAFSPLIAQTSVQRDQQALSLISQTIVAGGGQPLLSSIQDFTETGNVTYYWSDPVTASITIKSRGLGQFRADSTLSSGQRSTIVNGGTGLQIEADGTLQPISLQSASDLSSTPFPYLPLMTAIQDSTTSVISLGLVNHDGASVYDVRIQKTYSADLDPQGNRGAREARDFYIDPNTFLVFAMSDQLYFDTSSSQGVSHEILYSNYQSESGIAMPLTISETLGGTNGVTMQLSQVAFNSGLTDADFSQ